MKNFPPTHAFGLFRLLSLIVIFTPTSILFAQSPAPDPTDNHFPATSDADAAFVRKIYDQSLRDSRCYNWLEYLSLSVGHRLSGSSGAEKAVQWTRATLDTLGLDSVWQQPCMVPHWVRGEAEKVTVLPAESSAKEGGSTQRKKLDLNALALGGSISTPTAGTTAQVVEIKTWEELERLGNAGSLRGKIVFYNRPMDPTKIRTFEAYGGAVDQRVSGPSRAAKYGAVGVLVRSMGLRLDDYPHTGTTRYDSTYALIPAAAISTNSAEQLAYLLRSEGQVTITMILNCKTLPDVLSYNVIGEIRGSERPNSVLLVGGHLDSWDVGHGAHDDGAGCVQSMDVLRYFKRLGYRPRHTVRCVLFMNEENGLRGGKKYAEEAQRKGEHHLLAIESDAGGFTPRGFTFDGDATVFGPFFEKVTALRPVLEPYGLTLSKGGSGADIGPLKGMKGLLSGYSPDSQRYFDYHHTAADTFDAVNQRELELGAASMAALVYLMDKYGL